MVSRTAGAPTYTNQQSTGSTSNNAVTTNNTSSTTNGTSSQNQSGTQTVNQTNLTGTGLSALDSLIAALGGGKVQSGSGFGASGSNPFAVQGGGKSKGSAINTGAATATAQANTEAWKNEIALLNKNASDYSKDAAFKDSDLAVQGALSQALEKAMPTITAGIQAAGTSGSAMSALLTQKAAEDAAFNAAQLGVSAAISYGQIQNSALSAAGSLISSGDPTMNALLSALGINKGSVTNGTTTTNQSSFGSNSSSTNSSSVGTQASNQTTNQNTNQQSGLAGNTGSNTPSATKTNTTGLSSSGQNWYTPSSYQNSGYQSGQTSYSQFG